MSAIFDTVLRKIRIAFVLAALVMGVFGVASYRTIDKLADLAITAVNTQDKLVTLEQLNVSLGHAQVALRDYVLSGAPADLEQFQTRAWEQKNAVEALGTPPALPEQDELERRISERTQLQYEAAAARTRGDQAAAIRVMESIRSVQAEGELTVLLQAIRAREEHAWWSSHAVPTAKGAQQIVVAAGALLVAMFLWASWMVQRYERERRRVTSLLDDSETMTRVLAGNMAEGLVTMSTDLVILDINDAALKVLGHDREQVVGRPVGDLLDGAPGREALRDELLARLAQPDAFQISGIDMNVVRKDGRRLPVQVSLNDVRLGGRRRLTALIRDMSRIRAATEAMQSSEQHLREITDTLPVIIAEFDTQHRFRFLNRAAAEFLGRPVPEAIGRPALEVLGEALFAEHKPHLDKVLCGSSVRYEITAADASGAVGTYDMYLIPRRDPSGELVGFYAFATDITLLKRIDRMKTEFISTVSHELRTPLTSVRGSLGLMSAGVAGKLPEAAANLVGIAQNNCDRLIRLINDILDSEKIESGDAPLRLQVVELTPLVQKAMTDIEGFAHQHRVQLRLAAPPTALAVRVDVDRMLQVLTNLMSNAVKFSPSHAEVDVRVSSTPKSLRVEVADRGPGIPPEFQRRIFQKFSQADSSDTRAKGGTGLGLNISRTLVEKMGGQIGFTSTPGDGATFFFELPRQDLPAAAPAEVPRAPGSTTARKRRILHVEGDGDIRAIVSNLTAECAVCISAGSVDDARVQLRDTDFDLVLLEPELPDGSGWELLENLRRCEPAPPVVVFSADHVEPPAGFEVAALLVKAQTTEEGLVREIRRTLSGDYVSMPAPLEQ